MVLCIGSDQALVPDGQDGDSQANGCGNHRTKERSFVCPPTNQQTKRAEHGRREEKDSDADHEGILSEQWRTTSGTSIFVSKSNAKAPVWYAYS